MRFLPISNKELEQRGWDYVDIIIITGDAYVDHPGFGHAVIARTLEAEGYRVAILPQPNWRDDLRDFKKLGKPRLFFGISSGNMDSMVNHYTAMKRLRSDDAYTPGDEAGFRPDYATTVYSNIIRELYPDSLIVIGGIEASMRRNAHYDYWSDSLKPSILIDSKADILVHGMGEKAIIEIANKLSSGGSVEDLYDAYQLGFRVDKAELDKMINKDSNDPKSFTNNHLPSFEDCKKDRYMQAVSIKMIEDNSNKIHGERLIQKHGKDYIIINPSDPEFSSKDLDKSFDLPYMRLPHPRYARRGNIPAYEMIKHSINIHRGCFGGCSFCTISAHQGKQIISRSEESILREVREVSDMEDFKGYLSDLGGPSANMYGMRGKNMDICYKCSRPSCIFPCICNNLDYNHGPLLDLYSKVRSLPKIKKAFIGSGIRYDMFVNNIEDSEDKNHSREYFETVFLNHISGRLKVAPEHTENKVLKKMRKSSFEDFIKLKQTFDYLNKRHNLRQELIPYFISSHPGSTLRDMQNLVDKTRSLGYRLKQVQDFTPTPMTIATETFYTGYDIVELDLRKPKKDAKRIYTATNLRDKRKQNSVFFWWKR